jgi:hypothetical protein
MPRAIALTSALPLSLSLPALVRDALVARFAAVRERVALLLSPEAVIRAELLSAFADHRGCMPLFLDLMVDVDHPDHAAAMRVDARWRCLIRAVIDAPAPLTADGRATLALALAMDAEGNLDGHRFDCEPEYARAARALLAATRTPLPPGFLGFGDEEGYPARRAALEAATPVIPDWARAEPRLD